MNSQSHRSTAKLGDWDGTHSKLAVGGKEDAVLHTEGDSLCLVNGVVYRVAIASGPNRQYAVRMRIISVEMINSLDLVDSAIRHETR